jgi:hypothetical protein
MNQLVELRGVECAPAPSTLTKLAAKNCNPTNPTKITKKEILSILVFVSYLGGREKIEGYLG